MSSSLVPPQLVVPGRMLHLAWIPADPDAVAAIVPPGLPVDGTVVMSQHAGTGPGAAPAGGRPRTQIGVGVTGGTGPWWLHHVADHPSSRDHAASRGVPSTPGITTIDVAGGVLTATTWCEGTAVVRVRVRVGEPGRRGPMRVGAGAGRPAPAEDVGVARPVEPWEVLSLEFPAPAHPLHALRPAEPLQVLGAWCAPTRSRADAPSGRLGAGRIQQTRGTHGTG